MRCVTVLEGPDAAGKTSLARRLNDHFYVHQGPYKNDVLRETMSLLHSAPGRDGVNVVADRLHYGEEIYGPILRDRCKLDAADKRMIQRFLLGHRGVAVLVMPSLETVIRLWRQMKRERGELINDETIARRVYAAYHSYTFDIPSVRYDWEVTKRADTRDLIESVRPPKNMGPGVGAWQEGNWLFVGEQCNPRHQGWQYPFVGSTSGKWLTQQLIELSIPEERLYWVNALNPDDTPLDPIFVDHLAPSRVITLGGIAQVWAVKHGIKHTAVPHPSYWKRFHARKPFVPLIEAVA